MVATFFVAEPALALQPAIEADWFAPEFRFADGQALHNVKFHYRTLGTPKRDAAGDITNAILLLHGTTNTGQEFLRASLADELFGPGQPLDASRYYIIMPDGIGRGGSAKPSDGLKGHFPHYGYQDLVLGQYRLVTEGLGVHHLKLLLGVSMGGMNAWQWAERYPDMMDGLMPIACMPNQISGRNLLIRRVVIEAIRQDPDWHGGEYATQPTHFVYTLPLFNAMTLGVAMLQEKAPNYKDGLAYYQSLVDKTRESIDANDYLYGMEASFDYDPEPGLAAIKTKVVAVNFADDALNPGSLGTFEKLVARVRGAHATLVPIGPGTNGHFSLLQASLWVSQLQSLMAQLPNN
jgi:homoserine O-acetyltransferase